MRPQRELDTNSVPWEPIACGHVVQERYRLNRGRCGDMEWLFLHRWRHWQSSQLIVTFLVVYLKKFRIIGVDQMGGDRLQGFSAAFELSQKWCSVLIYSGVSYSGTSLPTDATLGHGFLTYGKKSYPSSIYTRRHCPHAGGSWSAEGAQWWGETLSQGPRSSPRWVSSTPLHLLQWDLSFSLLCFYGSLRYA